MAKATKMAVKSSAKSAKSTSSSVSKGSLGTIGDLRSKYRQDLNYDVTIKGLFSSHFSLLVNHKHMFTYVWSTYTNSQKFDLCPLQLSNLEKIWYIIWFFIWFNWSFWLRWIFWYLKLTLSESIQKQRHANKFDSCTVLVTKISHISKAVFFVKRLRQYRVYIIVLMIDHTVWTIPIFENPMIFRGSKYMLDVYN